MVRDIFYKTFKKKTLDIPSSTGEMEQNYRFKDDSSSKVAKDYLTNSDTSDNSNSNDFTD